MKTLIVCNSDFYLVRFLKNFIQSLHKEGFQVDAVCEVMGNDSVNFSGLNQIKHLSFPKSASLLSFFTSIKSLIEIIKKGNYKLVNSHNRNASIAARIAAWYCKVPFNLYTAHGYYFHDDQTNFPKYLTLQLERVLAKITTHTISQSQEDVDLMLSKSYVKKDQIGWIGNGVDTSKFKPVKNKKEARISHGLNEDDFILCSVGRIVKGKGFQDLIKAFYLFSKNKPNVHLIMIGGVLEVDISPFEAEIKKLIADYHLSDKISLTGLVDNVHEYLYAADVFVHPSYKEGMSKSMLEAMSCGLVPVVSKIRGAREVIDEGVNGYFFEAHDFDKLSEHLNFLYKHPENMKSLSNKARTTILNNFTEEMYINRQIDAIKKLTYVQ